jgi:hypothetical protein
MGFSAVTVNGDSLDSFAPTATNYREGKSVIVVGPIDGSGQGFVAYQER